MHEVKYNNLMLKIFEEDLERLKKFMSQYESGISVFGSARTPVDDPYYKDAYKLGTLLADAGHNIITGGGPGIMEAVCKGAHGSANAKAVGINIFLPNEQALNDYVDIGITVKTFAIRKIGLLSFSKGYVFFPGGYGTLDELTEITELITCNKIKKAPVILYPSSFWNEILSDLSTLMLSKKYISADDLKTFTYVDSVDEIMKIIQG